MRDQINQLLAKLSNDGIKFIYDDGKIILDPKDKPLSMTIPTWQFQLKLISYFNQNGFCLCGNKMGSIRQLHHAIISRNDVVGCKQAVKDLIHHSYNVFEVCPDCIPHPNREKSAIYLAKLYGMDKIIDWYNDFPLKTKIFRIESYFN